MVKKVEICSILAKLNINLKKDFESIWVKSKTLIRSILFLTSISHELETHDKIMVQPVEEMIFDSNSNEICKTFSDMKPNLNGYKLYKHLSFWGFNDNINHKGNISKMPSPFDVHKRNGRSRGKRKNGNFKHKRKNKTVWTLADLCKILLYLDIVKCFRNFLHLVLLPFVY